jgi:hypothetical protein
MSINCTVSRSANVGGSTITVPSQTVTADGIRRINVEIAAGATNTPITIAIDVSTLGLLAIVAASAGLTLKTNNSGTPDDTLTFAANKGVIWTSTDPSACPLTMDVTVIYVTNASGTTAATLSIALADDVTA